MSSASLSDGDINCLLDVDGLYSCILRAAETLSGNAGSKRRGQPRLSTTNWEIVLKHMLFLALGMRSAYLLDIGAVSCNVLEDSITSLRSGLTDLSLSYNGDGLDKSHFCESTRKIAEHMRALTPCVLGGQVFVVNRVMLQEKIRDFADIELVAVAVSQALKQPVAVLSTDKTYWDAFLAEVVAFDRWLDDRSTLDDSFEPRCDSVAMCGWLLGYPILYDTTYQPESSRITSETTGSNCLSGHPLILTTMEAALTGAVEGGRRIQVEIAFSYPAAVHDLQVPATKAVNEWVDSMQTRLHVRASSSRSQSCVALKMSQKEVVADCITL